MKLWKFVFILKSDHKRAGTTYRYTIIAVKPISTITFQNRKTIFPVCMYFISVYSQEKKKIIFFVDSEINSFHLYLISRDTNIIFRDIKFKTENFRNVERETAEDLNRSCITASDSAQLRSNDLIPFTMKSWWTLNDEDKG